MIVYQEIYITSWIQLIARILPLLLLLRTLHKIETKIDAKKLWKHAISLVKSSIKQKAESTPIPAASIGKFTKPKVLVNSWFQSHHSNDSDDSDDSSDITTSESDDSFGEDTSSQEDLFDIEDVNNTGLS